jgi:hypothetical protein
MPDQSNSLSGIGIPPEDFERDEHYAALIIGARRKAAPSVGTPAINRHLGFWVPDDLTLNRGLWIEEIENFIVQLYRHLDGSGFHPVAPNVLTKDRLCLIHNSYPTKEGGGERAPIEKAKEQPTRHQSFFLSFQWESMPVNLRLELIDEYFSLSTSIDLSRCKPDDASELEESLGSVLQRAVKTFNDVATTRYRKAGTSRDAAARMAHEKKLKDSHRYIYYTVWENLHKEVFATPLAAGRPGKLGKVFADFRSFAASRGDKDFIALPGRTTTEHPLEKTIGNKLFKGKDAVCCVDAILPFMTADAWLHRSNDEQGSTIFPEQREFTFTSVLNGRCIYASALGAPPSHLQDRPMPLTYMLLSANHCPSELGQLVDGLHMLGTTRLAALYDLPHIMNAALKLRELEDEISKFIPGMMQGESAAAVAAEATKLANKLPDFSQSLAEIERGMKDRTPHIAGGLPFRVERSHYYQKQFKQLVKGLRIGRIEGFPTYDESVARRLGGVYDLINTVGLRHQRLRETLTTLNRQLRATELLQLQNLLTRYTGAIEKIQEGAEKALFLFLFPYYTSSYVLHYFDEHFLNEHYIVKYGILAICLIVGVAAAYREKLYKTRFWRKAVTARHERWQQTKDVTA